MFGWHHQFNQHELGQTLEDGEGQGGLACYTPWGLSKSDPAWRLNNNSALELWFSVVVSDPAVIVGKPFHEWDHGLYQGSYKICLVPHRRLGLSTERGSEAPVCDQVHPPIPTTQDCPCHQTGKLSPGWTAFTCSCSIHLLSLTEEDNFGGWVELDWSGVCS